MQYDGWDGITTEGLHHVIIQFSSTFVLSYSLHSQYPGGNPKYETIHPSLNLRSNKRKRFHYGMVSERFLTVQSSSAAMPPNG